MSGKRQFRYALEPVRLSRQWELDDLRLALDEHNRALAAQEATLASARDALANARVEWQELAGAQQAQPVARFVMSMHYQADLAARVQAHQARQAELAGARDAQVALVMAAQRGVDVVDEHRDEMLARFIQLRLAGDFKLADDQWNTRSPGATDDGS
jgi:small-conductance mechanosensitive channel